MNQNSSVRKLVHCGVVAAIYVVLCLALQPLSYGAVQVLSGRRPLAATMRRCSFVLGFMAQKRLC